MECSIELDNNLLAIKKLCENIKALYERKTMPWIIWKDFYQINEIKGIAVENYNPKLPIMLMLKELGLESFDLGRDQTFFSYKELFKLYPKISEILLAIEEHKIKLRHKIDDELNKIVQEEHKIAKQAIIQFARS